MRLSSVVGLAFLTAAVAHATAASADEAAWRITRSVGVVRVAVDAGTSAPARVNQALPTGATVTTGAASTAVVESGDQHITMSENSRMKIAANSTSSMTRILEDFGTLLFKVDHQAAPHFRVETPFLAAVVKGTTFTVTASASDARVDVAQGIVEVEANIGGAAAAVSAGGGAQVASSAPTHLALFGASSATNSAPDPSMSASAAGKDSQRTALNGLPLSAVGTKGAPTIGTGGKLGDSGFLGAAALLAFFAFVMTFGRNIFRLLVGTAAGGGKVIDSGQHRGGRQKGAARSKHAPTR